jgi:hypothetical protein
MVLKINRCSIPKIELIGTNKIPVITVDDYIENHNELIGLIKNTACFLPDKITSYPGVRSAIPKDLVVDYLQPLMKGIMKIYNYLKELQPLPKDNYFSLITKQPNELSPIQSWPHFDTANSNLIAVIHYLGKGEHGGTGFFRHKKSGLECIEPNNKAFFYQCADEYFQRNSVQNLGYCHEQHNEFSCYKKISYKPNRLIVFPGYLLHSTLVNLATDISNNIETGRLTANMFIEFK